MTLNKFFFIAVIALLAGCADQSSTLSVSSPDEQVSFVLQVNQQGEVHYAASKSGEQIINQSQLGFHFANAESFANGLSVRLVEERTVDETWEQPWGERQFVRNHYSEQLVELSDGIRTLGLRIRVFDDGIGFRYEFDEQFHDSELLISDELTEFNIADQNSQVHWLKALQKDRYEYEYTRSGLDAVSVSHTPLTLKTTSDRYITIHEAALIDYSSMVLRGIANGGLSAELVAAYDGIKVRRTGAFNTPWRTLQLGDSATQLLSSNMVLNLNEPNKLGDVSWIKPGIYMGIWWGMHLGENSWATGPKLGATTSEAKRYIDFISEHGLDGFLVEGWNHGWDGDWIANANAFDFTRANPFFDLLEIARYAEEKNVELILHNETSGGVGNYERQMEQAYDLYQELGVHYLKTGYVGFFNGYPRELSDKMMSDGRVVYEWNHGQFMVNHYQKSIVEAAKREIAINMHEPIKPTGLRRTYPNFMTREGVRGQEYNAWSDGNQPAHTTILPFTRMMAGPVDFTPGVFDLLFKGEEDPSRIRTTIAKQLALMVVLYSPLQMAADLPRNYDEKLELFQFIKDVPADWQKSLPLDGDIGEFVVYARQQRDSDNWFVGGITNEQARSFELNFDFLDEGDYLATLYRDGADADWQSNPYSTMIESLEVNNQSTLGIDMAPGGGFAISVIKR